MRNIRHRLMLSALTFLMIFSASAAVQAHRLNVFASHDGTRIVGETYFTGGGVASHVEVRLLSRLGKEIATTTSDDGGRFAFDRIPPEELQVVVDTGDGHLARIWIGEAEITGGGRTPGADGLPASAAGTVPDDSSFELEKTVDRVVARRLEPLRREIAEYEAKVRLHDVLGGLGYLVGIAGLAFWWLARRESRGRGR